MKRDRSSLLMDLAVLVRRHPSRAWLRLAILLENDAARRQIVSFLKDIASVRLLPSETRPLLDVKPQRKSGASTTRDDREQLELELARSSILRLREIAGSYNLPFSTKDSRQRLMSRIARAVADRTTKKSERPGARIIKTNRGDDYAQWADIIIGRTRPKGGGRP